MDSAHQFYYFSLCVCAGFCVGIIYELFAFIRLLCGCDRGKYKILNIILDVAFFIGFSMLSVCLAFACNFPDVRVYMWIGYAVGLGLYLKTLRRILAFCEKVCYNKLVKVLKKAKSKKNTHTEVEYDAR
jgi:hypothetical protein